MKSNTTFHFHQRRFQEYGQREENNKLKARHAYLLLTDDLKNDDPNKQILLLQRTDMPYWREESIYNGPVGSGFTINRTHEVDNVPVGETDDNIVITADAQQRGGIYLEGDTTAKVRANRWECAGGHSRAGIMNDALREFLEETGVDLVNLLHPENVKGYDLSFKKRSARGYLHNDPEFGFFHCELSPENLDRVHDALKSQFASTAVKRAEIIHLFQTSGLDACKEYLRFNPTPTGSDDYQDCKLIPLQDVFAPEYDYNDWLQLALKEIIKQPEAVLTNIKPKVPFCRFYNVPNSCGDNCRFYHLPVSEIINPKDSSNRRPNRQICKYYKTAEGCRYKDRCHFSHP